jgi:ketosteroid isomerase-like protein
LKRILIVLIGSLLIFSCSHKKDDTKKTLETSKIELSSTKYTPSNKQLFDTIAALDKSFWKAYTKGDVNTIIDLMTDDHEFYHDLGGALLTKEKCATQWNKFFSTDYGVVGETVEGSNEVHEIPGYGALQLSYQRFYSDEDPTWSIPERAIVLWKETPNGWLQSRVFSLHAKE